VIFQATTAPPDRSRNTHRTRAKRSFLLKFISAEQKGGGSRHFGHSERELHLIAGWKNRLHGKASRIAFPEFWTRTEPEPNVARKAEAGSLSKPLRKRHFLINGKTWESRKCAT